MTLYHLIKKTSFRLHITYVHTITVGTEIELLEHRGDVLQTNFRMLFYESKLWITILMSLKCVAGGGWWGWWGWGGGGGLGGGGVGGWGWVGGGRGWVWKGVCGCGVCGCGVWGCGWGCGGVGGGWGVGKLIDNWLLWVQVTTWPGRRQDITTTNDNRIHYRTHALPEASFTNRV